MSNLNVWPIYLCGQQSHMSSQRRALPPDAGGFVRGACAPRDQRAPVPVIFSSVGPQGHFMGTLDGVGSQGLLPGDGMGPQGFGVRGSITTAAAVTNTHTRRLKQCTLIIS